MALGKKIFRQTLAIFTVLGACSQVIHADSVDPTRPLNYSNNFSSVRTNADGLQPESILYSESRQVAVINQQVLGLGDTIGDVKVTRIRPQSVEVKQDGNTQILALPKTDVKTSSPAKQQEN